MLIQMPRAVGGSEYLKAIPREAGRFVQILPVDICGSTRNGTNADNPATRRSKPPNKKWPIARNRRTQSI